LKVALDVAKREYKVAMSDGGSRIREVHVPAQQLAALVSCFARGKAQFGLPADAPVIVCHEAGRDAFWLHRALESLGVTSVIFDPSSLEENRRARRAKTDRIDARRLLTALLRWLRGEHGAHAVNVPSSETEDDRRVHRELDRLTSEGTGHRGRIRSLLATQGVELGTLRELPRQLQSVRLWNGKGLPPMLAAEILREWARLELVESQRSTIERERTERLKHAAPSDLRLQRVKRLLETKAIGPTTAWLVVDELGWRQFRNGRQVAAAVGLAPTPFATGQSSREQGIGKSGNPRVRALLIEIAWGWLRYQPTSQLTRWFHSRFGPGGGNRKKGIVALARKLAIALWRLMDQGVMPEGALLKAA
jgi:transposase